MILTLCYLCNFLAEAIMVSIYLGYVLIPKKENRHIYLSFIVTYIVLFFLQHFFSSILINATAFFICNYLLVIYCFRVSLGQATTQAVFLTSSLAISELLTGLFLSCFGVAFDAYRTHVALMIAMSVIGRLLYFIILLIAMKVLGKGHDDIEKSALYGLTILPIISTGITILVILIGFRSELNQTVELLMIITAFIMLFINIAFVMFYHYLQKIHEQNTAIQLELQKEKNDAEYYMATGNLNENQRILIHDMKNHLAAIGALAQENDVPSILNYVEQIQPVLTSANKGRFCSNPTLNALVSHTDKICREKGISFDCDIRENSLSQLDAPSLTALLGNLLSNAVESAEKSKAHWLEVSIQTKAAQKTVLVTVTNSCDSAPIAKRGNLLQTTKADSTRHGVGLISVQRIIDKYHGIATKYYDSAKNEFHFIVQFPLDHLK